MPDYYTRTLGEALRRLRAEAFLPAAVRHLRSHAAAIEAELGETVLAAIPAFSQSRNPDILPEVASHGAEHTREIIRLLGGGAPGDLDFVREHARRRAEQRFPLEATLHAYRCGHKVFARWLRESALAAVSSPQDAQEAVAAVADFALEYTDAISTLLAGAYSSHSRLLAEVAGDQRAQLLGLLLDGYDEADGRVAKILRDAGYLDRRQAFCVVLARSVDPAEMLNPARARRLADSLERALHRYPWRCVIDVRDNRVTIVVADVSRTSGWTVPSTSLAKRVRAALVLLGNAVLIGIGNDAPSTSHIPGAHRQAALALDLAGVSRRVVQFSEIPSTRMLLHLAGEEFQRVLPAWADALLRADDTARGGLLTTLEAYAACDMNVLRAAQALSVHANTVYARVQKILDLTGLDARRYHDLTELLVVADCARRHSAPPQRQPKASGSSAR